MRPLLLLSKYQLICTSKNSLGEEKWQVVFKVSSIEHNNTVEKFGVVEVSDLSSIVFTLFSDGSGFV